MKKIHQPVTGALNMVAGGVNPFGDDDRVPDNPIDPDLREKG